MSPIVGLPSSEVTGVFCRVPSAWLSQRLSLFDLFTCVGFGYGSFIKQTFSWNTADTFSIQFELRICAYLSVCMSSSLVCFHSKFRSRFTLRWTPDRRNPWTYGDHDFHMIFRYSCQYNHFWILQYFSQNIFIGLQNASLPVLCCFGK